MSWLAEGGELRGLRMKNRDELVLMWLVSVYGVFPWAVGMAAGTKHEFWHTVVVASVQAGWGWVRRCL